MVVGGSQFAAGSAALGTGDVPCVHLFNSIARVLSNYRK